jgi:hypothetical protein
MPVSPNLQLFQIFFVIFHRASGLGCNMSKCQLEPIRSSSAQLELATSFIPCQVIQFPVKYLGIPFAVSKLSRSAFQPLVNKVADKQPIWKGNLMNHSGRLELVKSTLTAILIYTYISLGLPAWTLKAIVKLMKAFLWTSSNTVKAGKCLVAWLSFQRSWDLGGLGGP